MSVISSLSNKFLAKSHRHCW